MLPFILLFLERTRDLLDVPRTLCTVPLSHAHIVRPFPTMMTIDSKYVKAAWYPDEPTEKDRLEMRNFFSSFARFYPCTWCATDFQQNLQKRPVKYVIIMIRTLV